MNRDDDRIARALLSRVVEPPVPALHAAIERAGAPAVVAGLRTGALRVEGLRTTDLRARLAAARPESDLAAVERLGGRLVVPTDEEWPAALAILGNSAPFALWVRGPLPLAEVADRSVAVVGARAATGYGTYLATELGYDLAAREWTVVSGGAYGIDGAAHRGAVNAAGVTVAVLACGIDVAYPRGHDTLFTRIAASGLLVSEWPLGSAPQRLRFLDRNRVIAALTRGTVVVEAAARSGALSTAGHADRLGRVVMAVPGPVTSDMSTGCHTLLRGEGSRLVTDAAEVIEEVGPIGELAPTKRGAKRSRDDLAPDQRRVLEAVPVVRAAGAGRIAHTAGLAEGVVVTALSGLLLEGFVEERPEGYRLSARERAGRRAASRAEWSSGQQELGLGSAGGGDRHAEADEGD